MSWKINLLLVSAAIGTTALSSYLVFSQQIVSQNPVPVAVAETVERKAVSALGYIEPQDEVTEVSASDESQGMRLEKLLVKRGDQLKAGQIIAILDSRDRLLANLIQAQQQVNVQRANLAQVKAGAKQGDILAQMGRIEQTKAELTGQITTQQATIASLEAQLEGEKAAQVANIERLQAELDNATVDCQRYELLYQEGAVATQNRDSVCLKQKTTQKQLQEAQANLERITSSRSEQITEAKANLKRTIATENKQLQVALATLNSVAEVRSVDVEVAVAQLESAISGVQKAKADLELAYVRAPKAGQVLKILSWPGEKVKDQGIIKLGKTDQMYVTAEVYETDITRVKVGQTAVIKTDGVTQDLHGTVDEIGLEIGKKDVFGTDPTADTDVRVVQVKIRLNPPDSAKVAGLTNLRVKVIIAS